MGVDGLTKYATCAGLYDEVDLQEMADDFASTNDGQPVLAVDGAASAWYLYRTMDCFHGGQYKQFTDSLENFVQRFNDIGIRLYFFFDGLPVEYKIPTWLNRRTHRAREMSRIVSTLRELHSEGRGGYVKCRMLPEAVVPLARVVLKQLDCEVRLSTTDCDTELAKFAASSECCIGVLSSDADFMIYGGVPCLITFSDLEMGRNVTGLRFRSADLASHLGIHVDDLPILASFVGNDIVRKDILRVPHLNLRELYGHREVIQLAAELLNNSPRGDLQEMCQVAFGDDWEYGLELVQESVRIYRYEVEVPATAQIDSKWDSVLRHVEEKHVDCKIPNHVFTVMKCRQMRAGDVLEDLSVSQSDSPPTGLVVREMLARMYTVLLWDSGEGPFRVMEYIPVEIGAVLQEPVEVQKRLPEGIHHPGLVDLWSGPKDLRWRIFTWVISPNKDLSALRALDPQFLVVPAAALFYLYHEAKILTMKEVTTFMVVAVHVETFSARKLFRFRSSLPTERAIYIATLFVRTALRILDVAGACGLSFPEPANCHLDAYFDGKFFHHVYSHLQHTSDPTTLTAWNESRADTFSRLLSIIEQ